ncbi:MAG TPA: hypothetical protein VFW49_13300, partial [Fluviicoccus sp.]|nr:hypothetical protein [Fluviicoccus sp.]
MKLYSLITLLLASLLGSMAMAAPQPADMKLVLDKQGIRIWSYAIPGSPLNGFKAVTTVRSKLSNIVGLITDTDAASRWLYRTSE